MGMFIRWLFYSGIYPQWKSCQLLSWLKYPCKSISFRYCLFHDNISTIYISTIIFPTKQYFRSWMNFPERSFKSSECLILQWGEPSSFACPRAETSWFNGLNVTVKLQSRIGHARRSAIVVLMVEFDGGVASICASYRKRER